MPVTASVDDGIVVITAIGEYAVDELTRTVLGALDDPATPDAPLLLFDLTRSTSLGERSSDDVRTVAVFLGSLAGRLGGRLAMVTSGTVEYGLMRMGSAYAEFEGLQGEVFADVASARRWLEDV